MFSRQLVHVPKATTIFCSSSRGFANRVNVILKQDVANLGKAGEEVSVKAGYHRNYLYPKKQAVYATEETRALFKKEQEQVDQIALQNQRMIEKITAKLSKSSIEFKRHSTGGRALYGSVTKENIAKALEKQLGVIVGPGRIDLKRPIKVLGTHKIPIRLGDDVADEATATEEIAQDTEEVVAPAKDEKGKTPVPQDAQEEEQVVVAKEGEVLLEIKVNKR